jgi:hypothetical protein
MNKSKKRERRAGKNFYFDNLTERNDLEILDEGGRIIFKGILE